MTAKSEPLKPHLVVADSRAAIDFYKKAFGAEEIFTISMPDGEGLMHAEVRINGATVMLAEEFPGCGSHSPQSLGGTTATFHLSVPDVDQAFARATAAGAGPVMAPADMFWGDRYALVQDPFGHRWSFATRLRELTPEEMAAAAKAAFAG